MDNELINQAIQVSIYKKRCSPCYAFQLYDVIKIIENEYDINLIERDSRIHEFKREYNIIKNTNEINQELLYCNKKIIKIYKNNIEILEKKVRKNITKIVKKYFNSKDNTRLRFKSIFG